ncbi:MAG: hypothetical protein ACRDPF_12680 [Streptosporangiaceae bacterium]
MMLPIVARARPGRAAGRSAPEPDERGAPRPDDTRSLSWNRTICLPGCVTVASSARPGTYQVQAGDTSVASPVRTFELAR